MFKKIWQLVIVICYYQYSLSLSLILIVIWVLMISSIEFIFLVVFVGFLGSKYSCNGVVVAGDFIFGHFIG